MGCELVDKGMRGVVAEQTAPTAGAPAAFRVRYANGTEELAEGGRVVAMLFDPESASKRLSAAADSGGGGGGGSGSAVRRGCEDWGSNGGVACPVCLGDFSSDAPGVAPSVLVCGHVFCAACIETFREHSAANGGACGTTRRGTCIFCPTCKNRQRMVAGGGGGK
jgi:hypothetical protein